MRPNRVVVGTLELQEGVIEATTTTDDSLTLDVGFEGCALDVGVSLKSMTKSLAKLQSAFEKLVRAIAKASDARTSESEIERASELIWRGVREGSLVLEHDVHPGLGAEARDRLLSWSGDVDDRSLPAAVRRMLLSIPDDWPEDLTSFRLCNRQGTQSVNVHLTGVVDIRIDGWLKEVNWHDRTARLRLAGGDWVPLRFAPANDLLFKQHANSFVNIKGQGKSDANGNWKFVDVVELEGDMSNSNPADYMTELEKRIAELPPYDPATWPRAPFDFDVDAFNALAEGQD